MAKSEIVKADGEDDKPKIVEVRGRAMMEAFPFARYRREPLLLVGEPYRHYVPLSKEDFEEMAYDTLGGLTRSQLADTHNFVIRKAEKLDRNAHLIRFGITLEEAMISSELNAGDIEFTNKNRAMIWDKKDLTWSVCYPDSETIWHSPYPRIKDQLREDAEPIKFILDLAGGDLGLYRDIMQSLAPIMMERKPDGVIWYVGEGANGKSTLLNLLYKIFPHGQLAGLNVKELEDGRDTPHLNRALANIVRESSEGRVEDTSTYKALGTHENFSTHKFHSQTPITVHGNIHSIFNANQVPAFNDKGHSARRRTHIIRFGQLFESNPNFEDETFTPEMCGRFIAELSKYAVRLRDQHYRYQWSAATTSVKADYDKEAGVPDEYVREMINELGLAAFEDHQKLYWDFEGWCARNGYPAPGKRLLAKAVAAVGFIKVRTRSGAGYLWRLRTIDGEVPLANMSLTGHDGLKVVDAHKAPVDPEPLAPEQRSILNNKW